ncbi:aminopeptidase N [Candidatus Berkiella aquae]|uniref:Aminopeptidase N n=1 Tax=Candidatus Berkiella aquae TaxID=295108 RepID=A0A0Q9YPZ4_9GAMM|nr:aminopeptidase N [Candidatus Berkiella aquae]MCS5711855.1 aminopeptidase N [Candidatus Berkiella aquae]
MKHHDTKLNTTYLKDYKAPDFIIESIDLQFELDEDKTLVHSLLKMSRHTNQGKAQPLILSGESLKLISLQLDGKQLTPTQYKVSDTELEILDVPLQFVLEIVTEIHPEKNTTLSGLYRSEKMFCTQCEAEGFRRMTYYLDRPDVMSTFTTTIVADKTKYPVLLSNGNKVGQGDMDGNRHWVKWHDPFKKPSYLFALVAGNLVKISDSYTTASGRKVALEIFVDEQNKDKCAHAISSLKHSMQWDEQTYGREYDLDVYMIVAANDFNMGAMENKGLNIFNSKYVLANEKTATDVDFQNVEAVIGHEYFHNWTGNRITCRDWFQLSLKEGLTVFREQQFSASMGSPTVKRINDVRIIRTRQFAEDAGPMAHPVRPESYIEINNFYTSTIYNKGAEVIRMLHTILGSDKFRKGMDLYFERHDGQAVTIEDFVASFSDANDYDLKQFHRWYHQAGTPEVNVVGQYNDKNKTFTLTINQVLPKTPDNQEKQPYLIPIKIALYNQKGEALPLDSSDEVTQTKEGSYLMLSKEKQQYTFNNIKEPPVPSLLGNFSAPVKLHYAYTQAELMLLMSHDNDLFNRWDSAQRLCTQVVKNLMQDYAQHNPLNVPPALYEAYQDLLKQTHIDPAVIAQILSLPSFGYIAETLPQTDVAALIAARGALIKQFAVNISEALAKTYQNAAAKDDASLSNESMANRALKNTTLAYLLRTQDHQWVHLAEKQYEQARNMTDMMGALGALNHSTHPSREKLFNDFYQRFKHDPLVVNKWLSLHATSELPTALENIKGLLKHEAFDIRNPNKVYALINTFSMGNPERFHDTEGKGYDFLADRVIELNQANPQVAARLLEALTQWKRLDNKQGQLMKKALEKIQSSGNLSEDVYEIVTKSLIA